MIVPDLQPHSRFCITYPPLEGVGGRFIINNLVQLLISFANSNLH